jgi:hypothetical protein
LATATPTPKWDAARLRRHHRKRTTRDAGCFEDLLGVVGRPVSEAEYEQRSEDAVANAWAEYEGEGRDVQGQTYYPLAAYYVDDALVVAITDTFRRDFNTCYHEHFGRRHSTSLAAGMSVGQCRLRYKQHLAQEEQGGMIRNVTRIRGV